MTGDRHRNVTLIGMMGVGKTTIGRHVARRLGRAFVDTDRIIQVETGRSIADIFEQDGQEAFRDLEQVVIARVAAVPRQIIAVGGGAVLRPANVEALHAGGDIVLLDAPVSLLATRVRRGQASGGRPLLGGDAASAGGDVVDAVERLTALWAERADRYAAACDHRVDSGHRPPRAVADEIVTWVRARDARART